MNNITDIDKLREVVKQGGGMVTPFVGLSRRATIDKTSQAIDNSEILGEAKLLENSQLRGYAKIMEYAELRDSLAQAHARIGGAAQVTSCVLTGTCDVRGATVLRYSTIRDNTMVMDQSSVFHSNLGGNTRVAGEARLWNVITGLMGKEGYFLIEGSASLNFPEPLWLAAGTRIHEGEWTRPPHVIDTPYFTMVEGVNDRVQIGCLNKSMKFWYKYGKDTLINYGLDPKLYPQFEKAMDEMREFKKKNKSPKVKWSNDEGQDIRGRGGETTSLVEAGGQQESSLPDVLSQSDEER